MKTAHISLTVDFNGFRDENNIRKILNAIPQNGWYLGDSDGYTIDEDHWWYDEENDMTSFDGEINITVTGDVSADEIASKIRLSLDDAFHVWSINVTTPNDRSMNVYALVHKLLEID